MTSGGEPRVYSGRAERGERAAAISNRMVKLLNHYTGRGPRKTRTTLNTNLVVVTFLDTLTKGEQNLVAAGQIDAVNLMRRTYTDVMRAEAVGAVEEILDRKVVSFMSDLDAHAGAAAMVFLLAPRPETGNVETAEL
jgi:uncharacterized protein YbcI